MTTRSNLCTWILAAAAAACLGGLGCGGEATDPAHAGGAGAGGASAAGQARPRADRTGGAVAGASVSSVPRIASVGLSPDPPVTEKNLRAVVRVDSPDASPYDLDFTWDIAGETVRGEVGAVSLPRLRKGDRIEVRVVARNGAGPSEAVTAAAEIPNTPPQLRDLRLEEGEAADGEAEHWLARAWAHDADGDEIEYRYTWLLNGTESEERGARFPTGKLKRGDRLRVRVVANDGEDSSRPVESGTIEIANSSPEIVSLPHGLDATGVFHYAVEAEDADGDRALRYELITGPRGMEMDAHGGDLTWTPEEDQAGRHRVEIAVDDGRGGRATQSFVLPVLVVRDWDVEPVPAAVR